MGKWSKLMMIKQLRTWPTYVSQHWSCGFWVLKEIVWFTSESETARPWVRGSSSVTKPFLLICTLGMVTLSSLERVLVAKEVVELLALLSTSESWNNKYPKSYFLTVHGCRCLHLLQHSHTHRHFFIYFQAAVRQLLNSCQWTESDGTPKGRTSI